MKLIEFFKEYYFLFFIPFLSISVFFVLQYLTKGIEYFVDYENGRIKWGFLCFMAVLQFFVSVMITWSVLSSFGSEFLSEYETLKITAMIIIGGAPFNITILIWVALKLEVYRIMRNRYGDNFTQDSFLQKIENEKDNE